MELETECKREIKAEDYWRKCGMERKRREREGQGTEGRCEV